MPLDPSMLAAEAVISRLLQMRQLWDDAAECYFDPSRFQLALQNCITVSRTVTFILQANKAAIDNFEDWYFPHQGSWRLDPIMIWAKDARNNIEKKGDLETYSQVRAIIIAGYMDGPETDWVPQMLFSSPHHILTTIPKKFLVPHVIEHGTLLIERRWIDSGLPHTEVLEALAHVYSRLADMTVSLLRYIGSPVPSAIANTKPKSMAALAMDRAIYLSISDGSSKGFRYFTKELHKPSEEVQAKFAGRYGKIAQWEHLKEAKTFQAVAEAFFQTARVVMMRDGYHRNLTFLLKGPQIIRLIATDHPDRASRYVLMRDLAQLAKIDNADGVIVIGEAWTASVDDVPKSGFAVDAKNRGEAIILNALNALGESFVLQARVQRRRPNSKKVKAIGDTEVEEGNFQFLFFPFMNEWECVDQEKLKKAFQNMDEMGIENIEIPKEEKA